MRPRAAEAAWRVSRVEVGAVWVAGVGTPETAAGVEEMESGCVVSMECRCGVVGEDAQYLCRKAFWWFECCKGFASSKWLIVS